LRLTRLQTNLPPHVTVILQPPLSNASGVAVSSFDAPTDECAAANDGNRATKPSSGAVESQREIATHGGDACRSVGRPTALRVKTRSPERQFATKPLNEFWSPPDY
jgi:hypothetical protein